MKKKYLWRFLTVKSEVLKKETLHVLSTRLDVGGKVDTSYWRLQEARGVVLKDNKIVNGWKTHIRGDSTCNYFMAGRRFMQLARGTTRGSNSHSVIERSSHHGNICRGG